MRILLLSSCIVTQYVYICNEIDMLIPVDEVYYRSSPLSRGLSARIAEHERCLKDFLFDGKSIR